MYLTWRVLLRNELELSEMIIRPIGEMLKILHDRTVMFPLISDWTTEKAADPNRSFARGLEAGHLNTHQRSPNNPASPSLAFKNWTVSTPSVIGTSAKLY